MAGGGILDQFKKGAAVEVSLSIEGFRGSWFAGTVITPPKRASSKVVVEFETLLETKGKRRRRESVDLVDLRPTQPLENRAAFNFSEEVDAYYNDGWWEGGITEASVEKDLYKVFFRVSREEFQFKASQLRLHREWVREMWVPPLDPSQTMVVPDVMRTPSSVEVEGGEGAGSDEEVAEHEFNIGYLVEISSNEEGFEGAWFSASILAETMAGKYLIEYQKLRNDDDTGYFREEVDGLNLRPNPPSVELIERFAVDDEVEALYNDGWWAGVVIKLLKNDRYVVYFENTDERLTFEHSDLRLRRQMAFAGQGCQVVALVRMLLCKCFDVLLHIIITRTPT